MSSLQDVRIRKIEMDNFIQVHKYLIILRQIFYHNNLNEISDKSLRKLGIFASFCAVKLMKK